MSPPFNPVFVTMGDRKWASFPATLTNACVWSDSAPKTVLRQLTYDPLEEKFADRRELHLLSASLLHRLRPGAKAR